MVRRVLVRSRNGNFILAVVGAVYALSAVAVLGWFIIDAWASAATLDRVLQIALAASALCGLWFFSIGRSNLRMRSGHRAVHK